MPGHITLNGKDYMIAEQRGRLDYQQQPYNPFAAQVGGGKEYDDLQEWSAWTMMDWRAGVGQRDPNAGGFLMSTLDTRFENRLMLPPRFHFIGLLDETSHMPNDDGAVSGIDSTIDVGSSSAIKKYGINLDVSPTNNSYYVILFLKNEGVEIKVSIYSTSGGLPSALQHSTTVTPDKDFDYGWYLVKPNGDTGWNTHQWLVVEPNNSNDDIELPVTTTLSTSLLGVPTDNAATYNGSSWSTSNKGLMSMMIASPLGEEPANPGPDFADVVFISDALYAGAKDKIGKWEEVVFAWLDEGVTTTGAITAMERFGATFKIYVGQGNTTNYQTYNGTSLSNASVPARLFTRHDGFLWRAVENDVYYTGDGSTWTGPIEVGPDDFEVRGMAGMGDVMYASTDEGLWGIYPGDIVIGITPWSTHETTNGRNMLNWNGDLYIPVGEGLIRFTENGQLIPMGLDQGEGLPSGWTGKVRAIKGMVNWMLVAVDAGNSGTSSVWAWNGEGWHLLAEIPDKIRPTVMNYNKVDNVMHVGTNVGWSMQMEIPDTADNPTKADVSRYFNYGWIEFPKFYGGLREIQKDFHSVFVTGENITSARPVKVFWKDEDSTDWEVLGTVTSESEELTWPSATRPNSRWIQVALQMTTDDSTETPVVNACRVKFHPMLTDLFRWNMTLRVEHNIDFEDGTQDSRTAATVKSDIETVLSSVPPVSFTDLDGTTYTFNIKMEQATFVPTRVDENDKFEGAYQVTLRQVAP